MADAAVFLDGNVRQITNLSDITYNNKTGFVVTFKLANVKYVYVAKNKFNIDNQNSPDVIAGYYDETSFLKYLTNDGVSLADLPAANLVFNTIPNAILDDNVIVRFLSVKAPYSDFCTVNKYTWNFDPKASVLDDRYFNIILQPGFNLTQETIPVSPVATDFYTKNIALITSTDFTDDKDQGAYYISLIALQIHRINKDIFPLFTSSTSLSTYIATQNAQWQTGDIFVLPSISDIVDYFSDLTNFYNAAYVNQTVITAASERTKLFWLINCLTVSGIAVLSVEDKLYILSQAILTSKKAGLNDVVSTALTTLTLPYSPVIPSFSPAADAKWLLKTAPGLILKIVESVTLTETQGDDFLAQLYGVGSYGIDKDESLFETAYNFLGNNEIGDIVGDNKTGRIAGGILGKPDDRKKFIELLYQIWNNSIYNPYYDSPKYTQPANSAHIYPESYYMTDEGIAHYNPDSATVLFIFSSTDTTDLISYTQSYDFSLDGNKITAYQVTVANIQDEHSSSETSKEFYGTYDLYQPVSMIGFKSDLDITMPNANCIPLFFLYYANDYKDVKDADALIELVINIALNFTGVGEVTDLEYLGYLKQVSKFEALENLPAAQDLVSWTEVRGINQAVQFNAGNALAISNYVNSTTIDPRLKDFTSYLDAFLGTVLLGSICFHPIIKSNVTFAAQQVTEAYDGLPQELRDLLTNGGVSTGNINAIRVFSDDSVAAGILKFSDSAALRTAILALEDADLVRFLNDFGSIPDDLLAKLKNSPEYVQFWSGLSDAEKDAVNADKVTSFTNWYNDYVNTEAQRRLDTGDWVDVARSSPNKSPVLYEPYEMQTIVEIDINYKTGLRASAQNEAGDAIATIGPYNGKSFDPLGSPISAFEKFWKKNPNGFIKQFNKAIDDHFLKIVVPKPGKPPLDIVVIDLKNFDTYDTQMRTTIMNKINDPNYIYKNLVTSGHLIIIN